MSMSFGGAASSAAPTPSSEWRIHHDIYLARPDVDAIVHTHSSYATALACARKSIPSFHYMVAIAGGDSIRCAPYATFGTQELSDYAVAESCLYGPRIHHPPAGCSSCDFQNTDLDADNNTDLADLAELMNLLSQS